ncbi:plasmid replication initiator protein, partial [Amaricoccus sp. HAR-UPW-R2A-40]
MGMATIWDADILIWGASTLNRMKQQGINNLPRTLRTTPYELLRAIKRNTGGRDYQELRPPFCVFRPLPSQHRSARQSAGKRPAHWLDSWTFDTDAETEQPRGMTLTLSDWVYEGIV